MKILCDSLFDGSWISEMNHSDFELLDAYLRDGSESAFTELLRRHVDLVYSAASRQVGFHPQAAEEVTQTVFGHLASKAHELRQHASLTGWLYSSTRLAATQYRRTETRRLARETAAHVMSQLLAAKDPEPEWDKIRPLLDEAMSRCLLARRRRFNSREILAWLAPAFLLPLVLKRRFEPMVAVRQWLLHPFGPFLGTVIKRQIDRHARFVLHLEVGAAFEHEESRIPAAIPDKVQQRRVALVVADIDVGAVVQEQAETIDVFPYME